jgi:hypothetical protein
MPPSWKVDKHYINCQTFGTLFGDYNFQLPTFLTSSYVYLTQSNVWRLQVAHQLMVYPKKTITASFMCKEELGGGGCEGPKEPCLYTTVRYARGETAQEEGHDRLWLEAMLIASNVWEGVSF